MTAITRQITTRLGITVPLLPATDDTVQTRLKTENGWVDFQTYFVHQRCEADVTDIAYKGAEFASATPEVLAAIEAADIIVFAPSNPLLSIAPMLAIPQIRDALAASESTKIAVSPLIGGKAIKGPAEKLLQQMSYTPGNKGIAEFYQGLCDVLVIDNQDDGDIDTIESFGLHAHCTSTLMKSDQDKVTLMEEVISAATAYQLEVPCA
jgi:LPPG:FO 2-phospho-L-lactate transferase